MTRVEAIRAMLDGKRVRHVSHGVGAYVGMIDGAFFHENGGSYIWDSDVCNEGWEIYQEPKQKVKMWQFVYKPSEKQQPRLSKTFHETSEDFIAANGRMSGCCNWEVLQRANWTEIEVEVEVGWVDEKTNT